jgi:DNA-binding SARP family transcriptional activator
MLRLMTFGGVSLQAGGEAGGPSEERVVARRGLALLVLLAAGPPAGMSRDLITTYLWPDSAGERARNTLRQTLFTLRRELAAPDLLVGGGGPTLGVNPAVLASDTRELERARAAGDQERVARLYAGPFLDGFQLPDAPGFWRWAEERRSEYAAWAAAALESLARAAARRDDPGAAAEWWRRLALSDPLNTRFVLELMAAQVAAGNPALALRHAQAHEEQVRRELGAPPDRALTEMVARIKLGAPATLRPPSAGPSAAPGGAPASALPPPRGTERFRDQLARELADRFVLEERPGPAREGAIRLYHARDRRHDRNVVLKVLHPSLASQLDVERFIREIRLTGRLLHPHILPLLDSGEVAGRPWFALPDPGGETLRGRLAREPRLPVEEAARLTREVAEALGYAHAHGVVHRDVSPENVLLADGHALLTNLGLARALDTAAAGRLTDTGMLVGAAAYMSPEQAVGEGEADGRSDIYSLAAVLFEMLAGEPLFSGPTPQTIMAKRAAEPMPAPARLRDLTRPVATVLRRSLTGSPEDRYGTMAEFAAALEDAVQAGQPRRAWWRGVLKVLGAGRS